MQTSGSRVSTIIKSERRLFSAYKKTHPHMWICLGSEALLVVLLITGGYFLSKTVSPTITSTLVARSGGTYMSTVQLSEHVADRKISAYWLGPDPNFMYSIICNQTNQKIVTLYPYDPYGRPIPSKKIIITTFDDLEVEMNMHPLTGGKLIKIDLPIAGRQIEYDSAMRNEVHVNFNGQRRVAHIHYETTQSQDRMIRDAESLKLVA